MTIFTAVFAFDITRFDLSFFGGQQVEQEIQDNTNYVYEGIVYEDSLAFYAGTAPDGRSMFVDGSGMEYDIDLQLVDGIVTRIGQSRLDGSNSFYVNEWYVTNFAFGANELGRSISSPDTIDDRDVLDTILASDDIITLSIEDDTFNARGGNDIVTGRNGNDAIAGMDGDDTLNGGRGTDLISGGTGADLFIYARITDSRTGVARDTISDFNGIEGDQLVLADMDSNMTKRGNQDFRFIEDHRFSGKAGELRFADGILSADIDGDRKPDFQIAPSGVSSLADNDLVL